MNTWTLTFLGASQTEILRIHGEHVPVRVSIHTVDALSGHSDREDLLLWLSAFSSPPKDVFVVHGEPEASHALAQTLKMWGWKAQAPEIGQSAVLTTTF